MLNGELARSFRTGTKSALRSGCKFARKLSALRGPRLASMPRMARFIRASFQVVVLAHGHLCPRKFWPPRRFICEFRHLTPALSPFEAEREKSRFMRRLPQITLADCKVPSALANLPRPVGEPWTEPPKAGTGTLSHGARKYS